MKRFARLRYVGMALVLVAMVVVVRAVIRPRPVEVALLVASGEGDIGVRRAAALYFDELNAAGGIDGTPVDLVVYEYDSEPPADDESENSSDRAERVRAAAGALAKDIARGDAWLVIGPGDSNSANAVAEELDDAKSGPLLAGITPTATADEVTAGHPGYFRTAPSTRAEGRVLAHYMLRVVDMDQVVVLYDPDDDYATAFSQDFARPFAALGGDVDVDTFEGLAATEVDELLGDRLFRPDAIVLALQPRPAAAAIAELRRRGETLPIVGGDSLVGEGFYEWLQQEPEEGAQPGVFSDGVYVASPFLFDTADAAGRRFRQSYLQRYGEEPGWGAATTHDAALVATEAIRSALDAGKDSSSVDGRAAVLAYLQGLTDAEAPRGLLGPVVFDGDGDPPDRVWISRMQGYKQLSAPVQLVPASRVADDGELPEDLGGDVLAVGGRYMRKARVVYTGMDFNQISNFDGLGGYTADFYLWFRYRDVDPAVDGIGPADITDVELLEVAEGDSFALSEEPLESRIDGGMRYELYRVKADFNNAFDFHDYPFDRQAIEISLRNRTLTRDRLIYVVDEEGLGDERASLLPTSLGREFGAGGSWHLVGANLFESEVHNPSTLGNPQQITSDGLEYSRLRAVIDVRRNSAGFLAKKFLPVVILMALAYLVFYMPSDSFGTINATLSGTVVAVALFHFGLTSDLPGIGYAVALDYAFYVIYVVLVATLLISLIAWRREKDERLVRRLLLTARIGYPAMFVAGAFLFALIYDVSDADPAAMPQPPATAVVAAGEASEARNTLQLASWRTDDRKAVQGLLDGFRDTQGGFAVRFVPSATENFDQRLRADLAAGRAADLTYARGNYRNLLAAGELVDLTEFIDDPVAPQRRVTESRPALHFADRETLAHFSTPAGRVFALPAMGISQGIYYNKAVFDRLGEPYPRQAWTWQELLDLAERIRRADVTPFGNATGEWYGEVLIFQSLAPNFVDDTASRNASGCFSDEQVVNALRAYQQLAPFLAPDHATISQRTAEQQFLDGKAAMLWGGSWDLGRYETAAADAGFAVGVFLPPAPDKRTQVAIKQPDFGIAINAAGNVDAAFDLLEWLARPDTVAKMSAGLRGFYPLIDGADGADGSDDPFVSALRDAGTSTARRWDFPGSGTPSGRLLLRRALRHLLAGGPDADPQAEAIEIQRGLAAWYEPAQRPDVCSPAPPDAPMAATGERR